MFARHININLNIEGLPAVPAGGAIHHHSHTPGNCTVKITGKMFDLSFTNV